jgi:hypothetical protein
MGGYLERKLVKPTKLFSSWTPDQSGFDQLVATEAHPDVGAGGTGILGEADATVGRELRSLDSLNGIPDKGAEFLTLFIRNGGAQVLNFDQTFPHKDHLGHVRDARQPGVAQELRAKSQ